MSDLALASTKSLNDMSTHLPICENSHRISILVCLSKPILYNAFEIINEY